uniref:AhpC-TSA domain-containing protein n=1 Tax=Meloidogyne hapla TaxID=6305 RepID=A0A1I8B659_MELHA
MTPKFNKLADEFADPIYVGIDVDENINLTKFQTVIEGNNYEELRKTIESNK